MLRKGLLNQFAGFAGSYRHRLVRTITYTEGVKQVAEETNAYWLVDYVVSMQLETKIAAKPFQVWTLAVDGDHQAVITCKSSNGRSIYKDEFLNTDFPLPGITFWITENVLLLPSEYSGMRIRLLNQASF
jgi:uncharacterized protein DUF6876